MKSFETLIGALVRERVEFILIGGLAAVAHGSARVTYDIDIVYRRTKANYERLAEALRAQSVSEGCAGGLTFCLGRGNDLLGEAAGGGNYEALLPGSREVIFHGRKIRVTSLANLIAMKRAAGRPKDLEAIAELESLAEEQED